MKKLNPVQVQSVSGGNYWLIGAAVVAIVGSIAKGFEDAHHEHCN